MWQVITSLIVGGGIVALALWLRNQSIAVKWHEWLIGVLGLVFLLFALQNFFGSLAELEPSVAWMYMLVMGIPSLILLAVAWQLIMRRKRAMAD